MTTVITSPRNKQIKLAASLKQKKYRDETGLFAVEGSRLAEEAVRSAWEISFCVCTAQACDHPRVAAILAALKERDCPVYRVGKEIYDKISDTKEPQGILLVVKKEIYPLEALLKQQPVPLLVALDGVQDPGNVGTMIRTADAAGCQGVVTLIGSADAFAGKAVRASMGSLFHLPVITDVEPALLLAFLKERGIKTRITALDERAAPHFSVDFRQATAVVFGNEGNGVSAELTRHADGKIFIPMMGQAESLNVAAATAIILFEGLRQRMKL